MDERTAPKGLELPKADWPGVSAREEEQTPIERLRPGTELHGKVLKYLTERIDSSEKAMRAFHPRWLVSEKRVQAYINLPDWEKELKRLNEKGSPPKVVQVIVPYTYATISTIVTYLLTTFTGRRPFFQVGSYKDEGIEGARMMELALQYNADHSRIVKVLHQYFQDGEMYGVGVLRTGWKEEKANRTVWKRPESILGSEGLVPSRERRVVYSGNEVDNIDPFLFFPDPNVPMADVNKLGEFVFWRKFPGRHLLLQDEAEGTLRWVQHVGEAPAGRSQGDSNRSLAAGGESNPGANASAHSPQRRPVQFDMGTIDIIPAELGLGPEEVPQKWMFAIGNKRQILMAEPFDSDHGMHPVAVIEPKTLGYGFGHLGTADYLGPIQDTLSWLVNSHITNVRAVLNNMIVYDPSRIEEKDLKNPKAGLLVRMKKAAFGQDPASAMKQLQVFDVTRGHFADFELFMRIGDALAAVNDNLRGQQEKGGRRSATEARIQGESAVSRLGTHARLISAQGVVDFTEQATLNIQQFMDEEFFFHLAGNAGMEDSFRELGGTEGQGIRVSPEMLVGDFHFPVHDGSLPVDRQGMLEGWKEMFLAVQGDPELRQTHSLSAMLDTIADLANVKNWASVKVQQQAVPDGVADSEAAAGNIVPVGEALGNL